MKILICLLLLSIGQINAYAAFDFKANIRAWVKNLAGEELTEKFLGIDPYDLIELPSLPPLVDNPKSTDFGNISDYPKTPISEEKRRQMDEHFIVELFTEVRNAKPSDREYTDWMRVLYQGMKREGIYRAIVYDKIYENLEYSTSKRVSDSAKDFTVLFFQRFLGQKISKNKMDQLNVYALKRIVSEKALQMIDALYKIDKNHVYRWYAVFSSDLASNHEGLWEEKIRKQRSPRKHYEWATRAGEQYIKSEIIIKMNKLYNHLDSK